MNKGFNIFSHVFTIVVCVAVIALYFIFPVWSVNATYAVSASQIKTMLSSDFGDYDLESALPEESIDVHITLKVSTPVLFTAVFANGEETVSNIVEDNVESIVEELEATIGDITKTIAKVIIVETIRIGVENQIKNYLQDYYSDISDDELNSEAQEIFNELDRDGFVDESVNKIVDALYSDNATVDSVTDIAVNIVKEAVDKLKESDNEKINNIAFSEADERVVREAIENGISMFANADGTINLDETIQQYILEALKGLDYSGADVSYSDSEAAVVSFGTKQNSADTVDTATEITTETTTQTTSATREEIKNALKEYIEGIIPEDIVPTIRVVILVVFGIFMVSLLCWVYVLIKAIVKLARGEDSVKLKLPIIFGWLPAIIFMFIPSILLFVMSFFPKVEMIEGLSFSFFSSGVCAAVAAVMFIIYSIVRRCVTKDDE